CRSLRIVPINGSSAVPELLQESGRGTDEGPGRRRWRDAGKIAGAKHQAIRTPAYPYREERQMGDSKEPPSEKTRARKVKEGVKGVFYGMAAHGHVTAALRTRMYLEHLFMFITLGDMPGVPVITPYYSLKSLPYADPNMNSSTTRVFRERAFSDQVC